MKKDNIIKLGIEKYKILNNRTSLTTETVQKSIQECGVNKYLKTVLLFFTAWLLKKKGAYSVINTYLLLVGALCFTRPSIWIWIVKITVGTDNRIGSTIISFITWWGGGVDYFVFWVLTLVIIIVTIFNGIVEIHKAQTHKELKEILNAITFTPDLNWFDNKCKNTIVKLGERYSKDNNFKNRKLDNVYRALTKPEFWDKDLRNSIKAFVIMVNKSYNSLKEDLKGNNADIKRNIDTIIDIYNSKDELRLASIFDLTDQIKESFRHLLYLGEYTYSRYDYNRLSDSHKSLNDFQPLCQYISKKVIYIKGVAGTGKSHLIADVVTERMKCGLKSLLILGLDFQDCTNPKETILSILSIKGTWDDFLLKLNRIGELEKQRILIFIDGINEGVGNQLWNHQLDEIETDILKYDNLGLVVSARTFMNSNMLDAISKDKATVTLKGFRGMEDEAITYLTGKYGFSLPNITHLRDFANPLFLKLYCKSCNNKTQTVPKSFLDIANNYLEKINENLSIKYKYEASLYNYVRDAAYLLSEMYVKEQGIKHKYKTLPQYLTELSKILPSHLDSNCLLQDLISEGILMCYESRNGNRIVDFNFEIVGDYICAYTLLKYDFLQFKGAMYSTGVDEAVAVLMPLVVGDEIFDCTSTDMDQSYKEYLFLETLDQRFSLSESAVKKIEWLRMNEIDTFYDILPKVILFKECKDIVNSLNAVLKSMSMIDRDTSYGFHYTQNISDINSSSIMTFAKWAVSISRNSAIRLSNNGVFQAATLLCWTFSIPYNKLRNYATKAVINLLRDKPEVLIELVELFDDVNDPYIQQRLYAVVHGCIYRGSCVESAKLAKLIYDKVFNTDNVRPDILLRDYARCAIDRITQEKHVDGISKDAIKPPYNSVFSIDMCPDRNTIESKYRLEYNKSIPNEIVISQNSILDSMETEYSNGTCGYGDFGRYTFESAIDSWGQDAPLLRNFAVQLIFEKYGYDAKRYAPHDCHCRRGRGDSDKIERYGKKMQWISMYEVMGLLADNFRMESDVCNDTDIWYQGTWDPHVRNIDTTNSFYFYGSEEETRCEKLEWLEKYKMPFKIKKPDLWLTGKDGLSNDSIKQTIEVVDEEGHEWTVLYGYNTFTDEDNVISINDEDNGLWVFAQAYVCKICNQKTLRKAIYKKGTQGRHFPEYRNSFYNLFYKEYYNSISYKEYAERIQLDEWKEFDGKSTYYQISYNPYSTEGEISILRLNHLLFDILKLKDGENDGEYVDSTGKLIAMDPSVKHQNTSQLLVLKEELIKALKENGYTLVWPVLCEKQKGTGIIGNQLGGIAYYNSRFNLKVKLRHYIEKRYNKKKNERFERVKYQATMVWYTITFQKEKKVNAQLEALMNEQFLNNKLSILDNIISPQSSEDTDN